MLRRVRLVILSISVFALLIAAPAQAQIVAYTVESTTDNDLYRIDLLSGQATRIGNVGSYQEVEGLSFQPSTGTLFGFDDDSHNLLIFNLQTGAATVVGASAATEANLGLAFSPAGRLFVAEQNSPQNLWELNPATGAATLIGSTGEDIVGLAFDSSGTLWGVSDDGEEPFVPAELFRISTTTGAATLVGQVGPFSDGGIAFDPYDVLWGLDDVGRIFRFNTSTGEGTIVGTADCGGAPCSGFESLAIDLSESTAVPELSRVGVVTFVLVVGLLGLVVLRRMVVSV